MLKKIITKNVGVLRAFDTPGAPQLAKLTTFYARNGRGKTTLSSVLRAAGSGDSDTVLGRKTLGNGGASPEVTLLFDNGAPSVRFTAGKWSSPSVPIEVFDAAFIADNLYAGEKIDLNHDRKLFTVILGRAGVKLARQQEVFNAKAKSAGAALKDAEAALAGDIPSDVSREEFLAFTPSAALDDQLEQAEKALKSVQQATRVSALKLLERIEAPALADDTRALLASTVADIQSSAREELAEHFKKHKLGKDGEQWVRFGRDHIVDESCPFCGREGVDELGLVTLYDKIFSESYREHLAAVKSAADGAATVFGADAREAMAKAVTANAAATLEWAEFCKLDTVEVPAVDDALTALAGCHNRLAPLYDKKRQTPLTVIEDEEVIAEAEKELAAATALFDKYNKAVDEINALAEERRSGAQPTEADAKTKVDNLSKRKRRSDTAVQARIDAVLKAKRRDDRARKVRTTVQERLKAANEAAAGHYHARVNHYLERFAATFRISEIKNSMTGNAGSVDYGLLVRGHAVSRGRKAANDTEPTFKNTLSTGDKATLALAFFLAGLDREASLADRIIVFDDPLSSHDSHRKEMTVELMKALCGKAAQLIVLSHDAFFLRQVLDRCPTVQSVTYEILFDGPEQWSRAREVNIDDLCRTAHNKLVDQLVAYHEHKTGDPTAIAPNIRKVLETHYRRTYPAYFGRSDWLGTIIKSIRDEGPTHPCYGDLATLESCNAATAPEHHGEDPEVAPAAPIDGDALGVTVSDCLKLINVLRHTPAASPIAGITPTSGAAAGAAPATA